MTFLAAIVILAVLLLWREHAMQQERREWTRERSLLLDRIKPETAQPAPGDPEPELFQPPDLDDDAGWWAARERMS